MGIEFQKKADLNGDGKVDLGDLRHGLKKFGDLNGDSKVSNGEKAAAFATAGLANVVAGSIRSLGLREKIRGMVDLNSDGHVSGGEKAVAATVVALGAAGGAAAVTVNVGKAAVAVGLATVTGTLGAVSDARDKQQSNTTDVEAGLAFGKAATDPRSFGKK